MAKKNPSWNTKYGPRRVRNEAPTLDEAVNAAIGMADTLEEQADIAVALIGAPREEVLTALRKRGAQGREQTTLSLAAGRTGMIRTVVVERKPMRRAVPGRTVVLKKLGSAR